MKIFYHGYDMDGKCSGAIVRKYYNGEGEYIPYNLYDFPFDTIEKDEKVSLVDCSCDFDKLLEITKDIVWIDHHISTIKKYEHLNLPGLRINGTAACELCWIYFFPHVYMPETVMHIGDYDVWKFAFGNASKQLQLGIRTYDTNIDSEMWDKWLSSGYYPQEELEKGEIIQTYQDNFYKGVIKSLSFFTTFEGYTCICVNQGSTGSLIFDSVEDDYDIMIPFSFNGSKWKVSLYTAKEIDVSVIAVKYGGGGHAKAAGFECNELPFRKEHNND